MKYVGSKIISIAIGFTFLLTGCEDPGVDVSTLGKKLAAPQLKGTSPFDQDFDTQLYARVQGSCDARIGNISISFDNSNWQTPPATPDTTGTSLSGVTNDINCSDGAFDVYLTKADLLSVWGITTASDGGTNVSNIYIKGETLIGETKTLTITDPTPNGSGNSGPATQMIVRKVWPTDYAGSGQCESFRVYAADASGNETGTSAALNFQLKSDSGSNGSTYGVVSAYTSWTDCNSGSNAVSTFSLPASTSNVQVYYRFPSGLTDAVYKFKLINSTLSSSNIASVTVRDPSSTRRFVTIFDSPSTLYKDTCYPFTLQRLTYSKSPAEDSAAVTLNLTSTNANLKFYSSADCASNKTLTSVDIASNTSSVSAFVKYTPSAGETTSWPTAVLSYTTSDTAYDTTNFPLRIDNTSASTVSKLDFWGPMDTARANCNVYTVVTANSNGTPLPAAMTTVVTLTSSSIMQGTFYSDASCANSTSSLTIDSGAKLSKVYFKATPSAATTGTLTFASSGLTSASRDVKVALIPVGATLLASSGVSTVVKDTCTLLRIKYLDSYGPVPSLSTVAYTHSISGAGGSTGVNIYTDSACTSGVTQGTSFSITPDGLYYSFYVKIDASYSASYFSLLMSGGPTTYINTNLYVTP